VTGRRAAIYTRISSDDGTALGVARQEADCRKLASTRGWEVVAVFTDNDVSASTGRTRPAYERMLATLRLGDADALIVWDLDRLTRQPRELEDFMDAAEELGWELASVGGDVDLSTPQGRLLARIKGSVAKHEAEQASRRIRRKTEERAEAGLPHGKPAYGWKRTPVVDASGHIAMNDVLDPEEAAIIVDAAERVLADEPLRSIVRDLNARGIPSPAGHQWQAVMLRQVLLRARNAGLRRHRGAVIGKAAWEPILSEATYERLKAVLEDPQRRTSPGTAPSWLLSGIARCSFCTSGVRVLKPSPKASHRYVCGACFKVSRVAKDVDDLVTGVIVGRLALPDAVKLFSVPRKAAAVALKEKASLGKRLDDAADAYAAGTITTGQLTRISSQLSPLLEAAEARARGALSVPDLADLTSPHASDVWDDLALARQRAVVRALVEVRLLPAERRGPRQPFDPSSVEITWRTAKP